MARRDPRPLSETLASLGIEELKARLGIGPPVEPGCRDDDASRVRIVAVEPVTPTAPRESAP